MTNSGDYNDIDSVMGLSPRISFNFSFYFYFNLFFNILGRIFVWFSFDVILDIDMDIYIYI